MWSFFCILNLVIIMTIYVDAILLLNLLIDLMLLITVKATLKRNVKFYRLMIASFLGSLSVLLLFIKLNSFTLFLIKFFIALIMSLTAFKFISLKYTINNLFYLYMTSTILGGFLYMLNIEFSYKQHGLAFYNSGLSINFIFLLLISPLFIYLYIKSNKEIKNNYSLYYKVKVIFTNNSLDFIGYLDTGNKLKDPITNKNIILIEEKTIKGIIHNRSPMYVPVKTVNKNSLIKCYKPDSLIINNQTFNNYLIGTINDKINIDGVNCLLNYKMMEELNV